MKFIAAFFVTAFLFPVFAFAGVPIVVPDGDALQALLSLIANWKGAQPLAIGAMVIVAIVQGLKQFLPDFKYKRITVTCLGILYGIFLGLQQGMGIAEVVVASLFVSGGAVAIYEALKPAMKKIGA